MRVEQTDPAFVQFTSMVYGYRALAKNLITYSSRYGLNTVRGMITRHAPASENNTSAYINHVCSMMGVKADDVIDVRDEKTMVALCAAISRVENGLPANMSDVKNGVMLALL